jgi:hypothetical protein
MTAALLPYLPAWSIGLAGCRTRIAQPRHRPDKTPWGNMAVVAVTASGQISGPIARAQSEDQSE